jgi:NTP-dependent ternary system trypsin peptidase co-occuring protein
MPQLLEFEIKDGGTLLIEVTQPANDRKRGIERVGRGEELVLKAGETLDNALSAVRYTAERAIDVLKEIPGPDEISVEFGVGFSAKANAYLVSGESSATFKVSVKWKPSVIETPTPRSS